MRLTPEHETMRAVLTDVESFPDGDFTFVFPEAIGCLDSQESYYGIEPVWERVSPDEWECRGAVEDELSYVMRITVADPLVTADIELRNESAERWRGSTAFNCFNPGSWRSTSPGSAVQSGVGDVSDYECTRHWVRSDGEFRRLVELPRTFGPRPTLQYYPLEGGPNLDSFPEEMRARVSPATIEEWIAIESTDGDRVVAVRSEPAYAVFQNMEYSCIHSVSSFGSLSPGESATATTTVYFVEATVREWYRSYVE